MPSPPGTHIKMR